MTHEKTLASRREPRKQLVGGATVYRERPDALPLAVAMRNWSLCDIGFVSPVPMDPGEAIIGSWAGPCGEANLSLYSVARCRPRREGYTVGASLLLVADERTAMAA